MNSSLPFDDFRDLLGRLPTLDESAAARTRATFERRGSGESGLADLAALVSSVAGRAPAVNRPSVALFAATHGVAPGVGASVTAGKAEAFVAACGAGSAAVNHLCSAHGFGLKVYDLALDIPTGDISREAALDERGCAATIAFGMEAIAGGTDLIVLGAAGVGGQQVSVAALLSACLGGEASDWIARQPTEVRRAAEAALALHSDNLQDPFEALRRIGGREIAALVGAILAARMERIPVVIDGPAGVAAAAVLYSCDPAAIGHCQLAEASDVHVSEAAVRMKLKPLLTVGMSAGEGTAGVLAAQLIRDAATLHGSLLSQG